MRVLVASWLGSTNLGDELVFLGLRRHLDDLDAEIVAISVDPDSTERVHGVSAIRDRDLRGIRAAARTSDLLVFGGGGLLQDQSSSLNLPYHLGRVALARSVGTPVVGLGLGVGPLGSRAARTMVRRALRPQRGSGPVRVTVRDRESQELLDEVGIESTLTADLAFALPSEASPPREVVAACLRPWAVGGVRSAQDAWRRGLDDDFARRVAEQLDEVVETSGLGIEFVAFQDGRDDVLHAMVAGHMRHGSSAASVVATLDDVLARLGSARAVVAMRYHGAIVAALGGRPSVLIDYSSKVTSLAQDLGEGAVNLGRAVDDLAAHLLATLDREPEVAASVATATAGLREREAGNRQLLEQALDAR